MDINQIPYETIKVNLAANESRPVYGTIKYLTLISATSLTGVSISFNGASFFPLPTGFTISGFEADTIYIRDTSGAPNVVVIAKGNAEITDNRVTIDAASPLPVQLTGTNFVNLTGTADSGVDNVATSTSLAPVLAFQSVFDGTNWDRMRGDTVGCWVQGPGTNGTALAGRPVRIGGSDGTNTRDIRTDTSGNQIIVGPVGAGSAVGTTAPVSIAGFDGTNVQRLMVRANNTALQATGNPTCITGFYNSAVQNWTSGNCVFLSVDRAGKQLMTPSLSLDPTLMSATVATLNSAATTNATLVKGSAGTIGSIDIFNAGASACYLRLYNKATAPTVGTDIAHRTYAIPSNGHVKLEWPFGAYFPTGIGYAITRLPAYLDTGAIGANEVQMSIQYT